jgi:hypothetical protein
MQGEYVTHLGNVAHASTSTAVDISARVGCAMIGAVTCEVPLATTLMASHSSWSSSTTTWAITCNVANLAAGSAVAIVCATSSACAGAVARNVADFAAHAAVAHVAASATCGAGAVAGDVADLPTNPAVAVVASATPTHTPSSRAVAGNVPHFAAAVAGDAVTATSIYALLGTVARKVAGLVADVAQPLIVACTGPRALASKVVRSAAVEAAAPVTAVSFGHD